MVPVPLIAKTVMSLLALLLLIIVVATPSLYEGDAGKLGVFVDDSVLYEGKTVWEQWVNIVSDLKTVSTVMKAGAITGIIAVAIGLAVNLGGYFSKIPMLSTVGMILEVIQIIATMALVSTAFVMYYVTFREVETVGQYEHVYDVKLKDYFKTLGYGVYLSCVAFVVIIINLCVGIGTRGSGNKNNLGQNYTSFDDGRNTQEMSYQQQTL